MNGRPSGERLDVVGHALCIFWLRSPSRSLATSVSPATEWKAVQQVVRVPVRFSISPDACHGPGP